VEHHELTEQIIGAAFRVYNHMGFGFLESVYAKCLLIELQRAGLSAEPQHPITVYYEGQEVGLFFADLLVEEKVIVELKSVRTLIDAHAVQLLNYLTATACQSAS
jgi:GxxExxY protein